MGVTELGFFEEKKNYLKIENTYCYENDFSLAKFAIEKGGRCTPLLCKTEKSHGTGLMNPSILYYKNHFIVNIRHVNYIFYHSEKKLFQHQWGPLVYLHPEDDIKLRTWNYFAVLDKDFYVKESTIIDTSEFDTYEPLWEFIGLEDARLIHWNNKLYITGVRRDTTTNGQGRMELSGIEIQNDGKVKEVSRYRIPTPQNKDTYCEKNWMPILDKPFHYIKWSNPTELVKVDIEKNICETLYHGEYIPATNDFRGGTQVVPYYDYYIAMTHEVDLFQSPTGRKDGVYRHRFLIWNKNFELVYISKDFSIMNGHVEFATGMCIVDNIFYITFGFQDNAAFCLQMKNDTLLEFLKENAYYSNL
jgi:predicted GH43/DUF377 family glycosyl hydrolase